MSDHPDAGKRRGLAACHSCGKPVAVKVSKKGLLYYICNQADEGCGLQYMTRSKEAETNLAHHIEKWDDPAQRKAYLGDEALPKKSRPPVEEPEPDDDDAAESEERDDAPAPAPKPKPKPKRAAPPPPRAGFRLGGWKG